jgi:tetratricopeptide (TPR) repeat protein
VQESIPTAEIEKRATQFLAQGKFRKARDEFKILSKLDKSKYLPLLVEANKGLMLEMLSKGMESEAGQVLLYLKTIATPDQWEAIQLSFACAGGGGSDSSFDPLALLLSNAPANDSQRRSLADKVILGGSFKLSPDLPASKGIYLDALAVRKGLEAISNKDFTGALDAIRPLAHDSVFSHWKLFIKGLAAFHTGDLPKANRFFEAIPPHTAPRSGAQPYIHLGNLPDPADGLPKPDETQVQAVLSLLGIGHLKDTLMEADRYWSVHQQPAAFQLLKTRLGDFPSEGNDWKGVLSGFCLNSLLHMYGDDSNRLMDWLEEAAFGRQPRSAAERMLFARISCLYCGQREDPKEILDLWNQFIELHGKLHGNDPIWNSEACLWIGRHFAEMNRDFASPFGFLHERRKNSMYAADLAIESLQKSVDLNPANLEAHLALCGAFKTLKRKKDLNRWRDVMSERFPEEKSVLIEAGCGCIDRRAYVKGIEYLERARHLDRLDASIPNHLVKARLFQARQYVENGNIDKARQTMADCEELLIDTPGNRNYLRSRWVFDVQRALMEADAGNEEQTQPALALAFQHGPFPAVVSFFAEVNFVGAPPGNHLKVQPDWRTLLKENFTVAQAFVLLEILCFLQEEDPETQAPGVMAGFLEPYLKRIQSSFQDRADLARLIELIENFTPLNKFRDRLVRQGLKMDPEDPLFQIYDFQLQDHMEDYEVIFDELKEMLAIAQRRHDEKAIRMIQEEIQSVPPQARRRPFNSQGSPFEVMNPLDIEDLEDDDFKNVPHNEGGDPSVPQLPPLLEKQMVELYYEMNGTLPDSIRMPENLPVDTILGIMAMLSVFCMLPDQEMEKAAATVPAVVPEGLPLKVVKAIRFWRCTGQFSDAVNPDDTLHKKKNRPPPLPKLPKQIKSPDPDPNQLDLF